MSQIKGKNTKPEITIRKWLWANDFTYRINYKKLPGKPDIVFPGKKKIIFIHGCFWHKHNCRYFQWPATNTFFWKKKIRENVIRDKKNVKDLKKEGWDSMIVWECNLKEKDLDPLWKRIKNFLHRENDNPRARRRLPR